MNRTNVLDAMHAAKRIADEMQPAYWLMAAEKEEGWYADKIKHAHEGFADLAKAMGYDVTPTPKASSGEGKLHNWSMDGFCQDCGVQWRARVDPCPAPTPATSLEGGDGLNELAFDAARKAYHQTHIGDYGPLRAAISAYVAAQSDAFDAERDSLTREIEEYRFLNQAFLDFKLVPSVPTRDMIDAWRASQAQGRSLETSYVAMIDAAPTPQTRDETKS